MRRISLAMFLATLSAFWANPIVTAQTDGCSITATEFGKQFGTIKIISTLDPDVSPYFQEWRGEISAKFEVNPLIFIYDDTEAQNCWAMMGKPDGCLENHIPGTEKFGTVLLGRTFMDREWKKFGGKSWTFFSIMAHEYAHIAQNVRHSKLQGRNRELQADYLAGWFLGFCKTTMHPHLEEKQAFKCFYSLGDNLYTHPGHHGTPQQREDAISRGYSIGEGGQKNIDEAYRLSEKYIIDNYIQIK